MAELTSSILEHECDTIDEKMQTIYQTDYIKRGNLSNLPELIKTSVFFFPFVTFISRFEFNAIQNSYACC